MAKLDVDFCGLAFKNPIIVSSIEPTNSVDNLKKCIDAGAAGAVVKERDTIPAWTLAAGLPAVPLRELSGPAREHVTSASDHYQALMTLYEHLGRPVGTAGEDS